MAGVDEINESGNSIVVDNSGNTYVTGYFEETVDFDPGAGTANLLSAGESDIFIARYDALGNYVYAKGIGSTGTDDGANIGIDASGNVYVTGFFEETVDFDSGTGTANLTSAGFTDSFVAGYDAAGNYVYANGFGSTSLDFGRDIAVDASGNVFITGYFEGTVDFDPGAGMVMLTSAGFDDMYVARYDASGNYVYAKAAGGAGIDNGNSIAVDGSGNVYVTGLFSFTADFDPGAGTVALTVNGDKFNSFVYRLNNTGDYVLAIQLGNYSMNGSSNLGFAIAVDAAGNSYITGAFSGTVDFDPGAGTANLTSAGSDNTFIAKYDASGNYVYAKLISGTGVIHGNGIALDGSANVYLTGYFRGTADFDPGAGSAALTSAGNSDIFIAKYDASGNYMYARAIGGASLEEGYSIAVDVPGSVYITGYFTGTADFDPGAGTSNLVSAGNQDIFIARYDASGNYVYARRIGGPGRDFGTGVAVDGSGNACLTGSFSDNADLNTGSGTTTLTSSGLQDIFIAKFDASGNHVYAKAIGGPIREEGTGIASDASGNIYLTGYFGGTVDFDPGTNTVLLNSAGGEDVFVAKYDASGNYVYAKAIGGTSNEHGLSIAIDGSGNAYITGFFFDTADFDPGAGSATLNSEYVQDIFVAKYDASGNYIYAKAAGGTSGGGYGFGIAVDGLNNAYISGSFSYNTDFDPGSGSANSMITAVNGADIFIAKYGTSASLPVELLSFSAKAVHNIEAVEISWRTASQTNNAYFEVERSKDGLHFEPIGRRQGCSSCTGIQLYELRDGNPFTGLSYYRLKQADYDHKYSYSQVVTVNLSKSVKMTVQAYPNITNHTLELRVSNQQLRKQVVMQLVNAEGRLLQQQTIWLANGNNKLNYSLVNKSAGVYYIKVTDKLNNSTSTVMIIKK